MSLLLDALKRAEQEKLARGPAEPAPAPHAPSPAPVPARDRPAANAASLELQPLGSAGVSLGGPRPEPSHTAQTVFQAKSSPPAAERGRGMIWATIGAVAVVVIAAGAYVWYSVKSLTPQVAVTPRPRPITIPPPPGAPPATTVGESTVVAASAPPLLDPPPRSPGAPGLPAASPSASAPAPAASEPRVRDDPIAGVLRDSSSSQAAPLRLDRTAESPRRVPADISAGYDALREGNLPSARRSYGAALALDPANLDAVLGMATIEARSGNRPAAALQYRRALELDPRNATAVAGLASLADFSRPESIEAQLRSDLLRLPESPALHFTLGNVLSAQSRWTEAQAEYFEAHRIDPASADVMFNLAVAMDHLGQSRIAAGFYQRALDAAPGTSAQFDRQAVARRLAEIR